MGKQGPCCHCGVTNTPLWRNGPPGKPVLCNACGSRWRTKGSLTNYAPLHARWPPPIDSDDYKNSREYKSPSKKKPKSLHITNHAEHATEVGETLPRHYQHTTGFEDDISNRSSSGSGISFSESCIQHGSMDGNDISGSARSHLWDSHIPSRKRTGNKRPSPSPVEKLRRDLCDILQEQESSCPSRSSEELLLFGREEDPMASGETGLGGFLIKEPLPSAEEESEASSLTRNKISCLNDANMGSPSFCAYSQSYEISSSPACKYKLTRDIEEAEKMKEQLAKHDDHLANIYSESSLLSNLGVLQNIHSPQSPIDLQPLTDESFTWEKETSSSSSHAIEVENPPSTDRPLTSHTGRHLKGQKESSEALNHHSIHFHPLQASSNTVTDFISRPIFRGTNDQGLIGCPNSSTNPSASSPDRSSTMLSSVKANSVETLNKDFCVNSPSDISFSPEEFLYSLSQNKEPI